MMAERNAQPQTPTEGVVDEFEVGDQVKHPKWGVGTILFKSGSGENAKVVVVFPEEGQKKLLVKKARLKKVQ
jgi:DNA helicase-2/ATP-dependent DNA helicase PcrA